MWYIRKQDSGCKIRRKKILKSKKKLHILKSEWFYKELKAKSKEAQENDHIKVLSFDFQQNMPQSAVWGCILFASAMGKEFLHTLGEKKMEHFFMYDETTCKKGANDVVSFLQYYIENILDPDVRILYLFSDKCCSQNKNHTLVRFLATLCYTGRFDTIVHRFPEPGHSFLPCDRFFGIIEKKKRRIGRVHGDCQVIFPKISCHSCYPIYDI